jgi:uncharacterized protein (DUF433 family)
MSLNRITAATGDYGNTGLVAMSRVESIPGKVSGAWVFCGTRMPVAIVFENLEAGASIAEIMERFDIMREQIKEVLNFAARSLHAGNPAH